MDVTSVDTLPNGAAEPLQAPKAREQSLHQLHTLGDVVEAVQAECRKQYGQDALTLQISQLIGLGRRYEHYLDTAQDNIPDNIFELIRRVAQSAFLLNIKLYAQDIRSLAMYAAANPEFGQINPLGNPNDPWKGIQESLYHSTFNDHREQFREGILAEMATVDPDTKFDSGKVEHLERFLVDPEGRSPGVFIPEYVKSHWPSVSQTAEISLREFRSHIQSLSPDDLRRIEEELASIKPEHLINPATSKSCRYLERAKKLAFVRAVRFNRVNPTQIRV